jgi:phosphoribosylaminoimidazole (AIR) synthetase
VELDATHMQSLDVSGYVVGVVRRDLALVQRRAIENGESVVVG